VSAVGLVSAFVLNLSIQGLGCLFWAESSDSAACSNIMGKYDNFQTSKQQKYGGSYVKKKAIMILIIVFRQKRFRFLKF